jgi:hypothetical protein
MKNSSYPALLNKRARILASLNRTDLIIVGSNYLILSQLKVSGVSILILSMLLLMICKYLTTRIEKAFLCNVFNKRNVDWHSKIGGIK